MGSTAIENRQHRPCERRPALPSLLDAARNGDEDAFRRLVEGQRAALHSHCHRMLGTPHDVEDAFQETMLRAWRGLPGYQGRSSLRTWLHRIATNVCINAIEGRTRRVTSIDLSIGSYEDEDLDAEDAVAIPAGRYEQREALELALIATLRHLPARQRVVLILRDALGFTAGEVAVMLETSVAATNSALQRARAALERLPARNEQTTLRSLGDARARELVEQLADAFERGDIGAILALLAEAATFRSCGARQVERARTIPRDPRCK